MPSNRQIVLTARPRGLPRPDDFALVESPVPSPADGQVLMRHDWLGLAPAARLRMDEAGSYSAPMSLGDVVYGQAIGTVLHSRHPDFEPGDMAMAMRGGWQGFSALPGGDLNKIDPQLAPPPAWLGPLGTSGLAAYIGLLEHGRPRQGETVVVSAAAGAVGSVVGQIARIHGCRVVGIAGGADKQCAAVEEFGFDACVDHHDPDLAQALARACPDGIDVSFENAGGVSRDAVWPLMARGGRIVVCGLISEYNAPPATGPGWYRLLTQRLTIRGYITSDHLHLRGAFERDMARWWSEGRIRMREDVSQGLASAPAAFIGMLQGHNRGKVLVSLAADHGEAA
ncbi:NADPH-dependent curcumin reductase [Variovorax sp. PBL-H6]|uniref:NADP-dependent oxidoreductase n=1 Tax=Variovorax sp. PBL-H6 TaxID=434009 RepID=UPI00131758CA|nr:NADP-dependent oxidoreductase [Variovorax sp. PBL-H6]VTU27171.1 NADPH-dependent curcumin reductase [Variovorax sp. PBL-H6]